MASSPAFKVPLAVPKNPSLALLASLAALAIDAAILRRPYNPEPIEELARFLTDRLPAPPAGEAAAARIIDPETTGLLAAAVAADTLASTVDSLASEGSGIAQALRIPLETQNDDALRSLRDFATRLSFAAQPSTVTDSIF